jgi:hypothetical protein
MILNTDQGVELEAAFSAVHLRNLHPVVGKKAHDLI